MKSYKSLLESFVLLTEDRIDYLKQQFKDKLSTDHDELAKHKTSDKIIDHFASKADPSTGKVHTQWLIGQYVKKNIRQEDAPQLKSTLSDFNLVKDNLEKKDLNQYKDIGELRDAIATQKATTEKRIKMKKAESTEKSAKMEKLYDENGVTGYKIPNKAVSIKNYGPQGTLAQTHWCTAANSENNMFNSYKGGKYTMHFPNDEVLQFHHQSNQLKDKFDTEIKDNDPRFADHWHHISKFINQTSKNETGQSGLMGRFKYYESDEIEKHLSNYETEINNRLSRGNDITDIAYSIQHHHSHDVLSDIAKRSPLTNEHFNRIASLPVGTKWGNRFGVSLHLGENKNLTHEQIGHLLHSPLEADKANLSDHLKKLSSNTAVKGEHLDTLFANRHLIKSTGSLNVELSNNPNLQKHHIDQLIENNNTHQYLASNQSINLSPEHQKKIIDSNSYTLDFANRKDLHPETISTLIKSGSSDIIKKLIDNPNAHLADHHIDSIIQRKKDNINTNGKLFASSKVSPEQREAIFTQILQHPIANEISDATESKFMTKDHIGRMIDAYDIHKHHDKNIARSFIYNAAYSSKASNDHLNRIIGALDSNSSSVVSNLLDNKNLKPTHLSAIHDFITNTNALSYQKEKLLDHPNVNSELLHSVFDNGNNLDKTAVLHHPIVQLSHFQKAMDIGRHLHGAITSSPSAPPSILEKLSESPFSFVRENIASHKNTNSNTLKKLANDSNEDVSTIAKKRLKI